MSLSSKRIPWNRFGAREWGLLTAFIATAAALVAAGGVLAAPDLSVSVSAAANATDNGTVDFNVTVVNSGDSTADPVFAQLFIDDVAAGPALDYGSVAAGANESQTRSSALFCGWHTINATVDPAGLVAEANETNNTRTMPFKVVPYVNFSWALSGPLGNYTLTLNASQSHGCGALTFNWTLDGVDQTGTEVTYNPPAGTLPLMLEARPADATLAATVTSSITVPNLGPSLSVSLPNTTLKTLTPLQLSIGALDEDGVIASYFTDFGDGNTSTMLGTGAAYRYHYAGHFTVLVRVTDNLGASNETTVSVTVTNQAPIVELAFDFWVATVGDKVEFNASRSSDPEGGGLTYTWDFGDGSTATGPVVNHSFASPGLYKVNVTATDAAGASVSKTEKVTVLSGSGGAGTDVILWGGLLVAVVLGVLFLFLFLSRRRKAGEAKPPAPGEGSFGKPPSG